VQGYNVEERMCFSSTPTTPWFLHHIMHATYSK